MTTLLHSKKVCIDRSRAIQHRTLYRGCFALVGGTGQISRRRLPRVGSSRRNRPYGTLTPRLLRLVSPSYRGALVTERGGTCFDLDSCVHDHHKFAIRHGARHKLLSSFTNKTAAKRRSPSCMVVAMPSVRATVSRLASGDTHGTMTTTSRSHIPGAW